MRDWEMELLRYIVDFAEREKLSPAHIVEFQMKFLAVSMKGETDEEDLRIFMANTYQYLLKSHKILSQAREPHDK